MDPNAPNSNLSKQSKQSKQVEEKPRKRGRTKERLDVAHSGVSKSLTPSLVGANFITVAETVHFTVNLHF
nr:MAG: movement protein 1 [Calystegia pelarspovirus 1]UVK78440.1 MAG: movement protein 1 [Calystegia pelarspovirus 1]